MILVQFHNQAGCRSSLLLSMEQPKALVDTVVKIGTLHQPESCVPDPDGQPVTLRMGGMKVKSDTKRLIAPLVLEVLGLHPAMEDLLPTAPCSRVCPNSPCVE